MRWLVFVAVFLMAGSAAAQTSGEVATGGVIIDEPPDSGDPAETAEETEVADEPIQIGPARDTDWQERFESRRQDRQADVEVLSTELVAAIEEANLAELSYIKSDFEHRRKVFDWQLYSGMVIFAVVIALVLLGCYFSWVQFMAGHRRRLKGEEVEDTSSTVEASLQGFKLSSPVIGILILAISLGFFYLYLVHVYPISVVK